MCSNQLSQGEYIFLNLVSQKYKMQVLEAFCFPGIPVPLSARGKDVTMFW